MVYLPVLGQHPKLHPSTYLSTHVAGSLDFIPEPGEWSGRGLEGSVPSGGEPTREVGSIDGRKLVVPGVWAMGLLASFTS